MAIELIGTNEILQTDAFDEETSHIDDKKFGASLEGR